MKTTLLLVGTAFIFSALFIQGKKETPVTVRPHRLDTTLVISPEAKAVIEAKCRGCHHFESKNEKAKRKLNFDSLTLIPLAKKIAKLDKIAEVLEKGKMPPAKFLEFKPEGKLSEDQVKTLKSWASQSADQLMKK